VRARHETERVRVLKSGARGVAFADDDAEPLNAAPGAAPAATDVSGDHAVAAPSQSPQSGSEGSAVYDSAAHESKPTAAAANDAKAATSGIDAVDEEEERGDENVAESVSVLIYRYISRESCSQFDSLPLTSLMCSWATRTSRSL